MSREHGSDARSPGRPSGRRGPDTRAAAARDRFVVGVAAVGVVLAAAACGAPPASPSAGPAPAADSSAPAGAPDPNAPEVVAAGDIPDNQVFVPVTPAGAPFTVSVPQGWARSSDAGATVFTDKFNSVRIETRPLAAAPDVASVRAEDVPQLQRSAPGFALGDVQAVQRRAGPAVLATYTANSPTDPVTGKSVTEAVERYAFWGNGQEAILTLSGPNGSDNVDPWRTITDSLRWQL
ncbi:MAG: hypothetical protein JWP64_4778 [Pseudonocardia sp.]|jgi:hypothetical protein|uniref:hypothetical protein n=1 Tax=Pseudonocardia sp. TaxID=60912 RepID=UPI0026231B85|nr:hypothetical protein [Pseudonocardia sp.]MCU1629829.1 hypothetical protein [Pseudonocardia sp.]MDT7698398.1 hypothetical protein [Pseudonocardiales bacterium]